MNAVRPAQPSAKATTPQAISDAEFLKFREFFYRRTGIHFENSKRYFVDKRLVERMAATDSTTFNSWFSVLRSDPSGAEMQALINVMTVNETYFLREEYQFAALVGSVLPDVVARKRDTRPIRIWCMPSSSGEEPYTVAMVLLERWAGLKDWDVEIISSDIDTDILTKARIGHYHDRSVQHLPQSWLKKYFARKADGWQINDTLRGAVEFSRCNLCLPQETAHYRDFDVVFCRNLLIYFDDASRRIAAEALYEALNPGGYVMLGHSESMSRISSLFRVRRFPDALAYQKPQEVA
ncbi:protein-glutamate O-methyltransferase CheR [Novosphingobium sp. FKTRR1]|uniref:CheR family methyltransferase n=1 Tax=unclassified Novosphingobium TaxID=2644732 RepID=UPI001CF0818B|nr:protein-glutamate O-methyltransferase CheR [Novosphingobium sp. FKTRR1]